MIVDMVVGGAIGFLCNGPTGAAWGVLIGFLCAAIWKGIKES